MNLDQRHRNYIRACMRFMNWTRETCNVDPYQHPKIASMFEEIIPLTLEEISMLDKHLLEDNGPGGVYTVIEMAEIINQRPAVVSRYVLRTFKPEKEYGQFKFYSSRALWTTLEYFKDKDAEFEKRFHLDEETK